MIKLSFYLEKIEI